MKHARLMIVLIFAAMLLILGLLVASVTSCSPTPATTVQPSTLIIDGSLYHPYRLDVPGVHLDWWNATTEAGQRQWIVNDDVAAKVQAGSYILENGAEYQISGINQKHQTLSCVVLGN